MPPCFPTTPRIAIAGWDLVTPLGTSAWQTFAALLAGRSIADRPRKMLDEGIANPDPVALVRATGCVASVQHTATDPSVTLVESAARQALLMAGIPEHEFPGIPCFLGVSKGAMHVLQRFSEGVRMAGVGGRQNPAFEFSANPQSEILFPPLHYLTHHLRQRLGLGHVHTTVAACASSLTALHLARQALLQDDGPRRALVVTSEASLLPLFIHSYRRLGVLPELTLAGYRGLPLDQRRSGFMLAEQAAAVMLERQISASRNSIVAGSNAKHMSSSDDLLLLDTAIACEGHHLMQPAPGMPALRHVAEQLWAGRKIDVLHPHATGTVDNDETEMAVYAKVAGGHFPAIYAAKGAIGHGLGAAGLVALVLACLIAKTGRIPPMPWLAEPITGIPGVAGGPPRDPAGARLNEDGPGAAQHSERLSTHAIFTAGFGGHVAGAVIGRT